MAETEAYLERIMKMMEEESDPSDPDFGDPAEHQECGDDCPIRALGGDSSSDDSDSDEDEDDLMERFEMEVEDAVAQFRDEHPICHNDIPDSDDEDEEQGRESATIRRGNGDLALKMRFNSGLAFKEAVLDYVLKTGKNLKQYRWDATKIGFCCGFGGGCPWRVYASLVKKLGVWEIKRIKDWHTCVANGSCAMFKVPVIARLFLDKIRQDPDMWLPQKIEEYILEHWKLSPTKNQVQAARKKALKWLDKEFEEQFAHIKQYGAEILDSNPGSTVDIGTVTNDEGEEVFQRFYVCFDNIKKSWRENCRPVIGVDGCFIKTRMKGQVLVAVGRDADNRIYPVAWAVVQVENEDNWLWFVQLLKRDFLISNGKDFILLSDRQKGLLKAVATELPMIEHRMCVRHIYANLKSAHGRKMGMMKPLIWSLAWSYNEAEYRRKIHVLRWYDLNTYNDVMKSNPMTWCRVFYKIGNYCEDVDNNSTESYNSTLVRAREMALVPMLEAIRRQAMVRISTRFDKAEKHTGICTPYVMKLLDLEHELASMCKIYRSNNGYYEAYLNGHSERVHLELQTCSCRKWEVRGVPCEHAYGVILHKKLTAEDFVAPCFRTEVWRDTYALSITPLRGAQHWCLGETSIVIPPEVPAQPRRKKQNKNKKQKRKKGVNESPTKKASKARRTVHCKKCGLSGHNSRSCGKNGKEGEASQSQEGEASQSQVGEASQLTQAGEE